MKLYNVYSSGENYGDYEAQNEEGAVELARREWDLTETTEIFAVAVEREG